MIDFKDDIERIASSEDQEDLYTEDMKSNDWLGIIVNNEDPLFMGRCKVKVFEKFDNIPDEDLPWAFPQQSTIFAGNGGGGSFSTPKINTLVRIKFQNGDWVSPEYNVIENLNEKMISEIKDSYVNAHVLVFDEEENLKIIYTKSKGLFIQVKDSYINIDNNTNITEKSSNHYVDASKVKVGTNASHPDTKCDKLFELLDKMAQAIDKKYGVPSTCSAFVKSAKASTCSEVVSIA